MSLVDSAVDGLLGALFTGVPSLVLLVRARPRRAQVENAWKQQADELQRLLAAEQEQQSKYLRAEIRRKDSEITRLQRLLSRAQGGSNDD